MTGLGVALENFSLKTGAGAGAGSGDGIGAAVASVAMAAAVTRAMGRMSVVVESRVRVFNEQKARR